MEIVANTEYQDIYRITDGVLLVVNKFIPIDYSNQTKEYIHVYMSEVKYKSYNKNCQNYLKVLKENYESKYCPVIIPKGTVTYMSIPVICTKDKDKWTYELRTTGTAFSGTYSEISKILDDVVDCVVISRRSNYGRN